MVVDCGHLFAIVGRVPVDGVDTPSRVDHLQRSGHLCASMLRSVSAPAAGGVSACTGIRRVFLQGHVALVNRQVAVSHCRQVRCAVAWSGRQVQSGGVLGADLLKESSGNDTSVDEWVEICSADVTRRRAVVYSSTVEYTSPFRCWTC